MIKILEEYANDKDSQAIYGEERLRLILGDCKIEIEKLPTAYDVDKVVEHIESSSTDKDGIVCYVDEKPVITKEVAIKIIKSGGIE